MLHEALAEPFPTFGLSGSVHLEEGRFGGRALPSAFSMKGLRSPYSFSDDDEGSVWPKVACGCSPGSRADQEPGRPGMLQLFTHVPVIEVHPCKA